MGGSTGRLRTARRVISIMASVGLVPEPTHGHGHRWWASSRSERRTVLSRRRSLAALLGVVVLLSACASAQTQSSSAAASVASTPSAVAFASAASSPAGAGWIPLTDMSAFGLGRVAAITQLGSKLVAVGSAPDAGTTRIAVWTSADGLSWKRARDEPSFAQAEIEALARSGSRLVAVGCAIGSEICSANDAARVWTSSDGAVWTPAAFGSGFDPTARWYNAVTGGGPGFVAVGSDFSGGFPQVPADSSIVTSRDGATWTPVAASPGFKAATMGGVAAAGAILVVVGSGSNGAPAVWTSSDGRAWARVATSGLPTDAEVRDVTAGGPGVIAVGREGGNAASWTSSDGRSWRQAPTAGALGGARMLHIVTTSHGFSAIGTVSDGSGAAWTSPDGTSWTKLDLGATFAGALISAVGEIGGRTVVFGATQAGKPIAVISAP